MKNVLVVIGNLSLDLLAFKMTNVEDLSPGLRQRLGGGR